MSIERLVERTRQTAGALVERSTEVLSQVVTPDAAAVAVVIRARHVGPLPTPFGDVRGRGDIVEVRVIDVLPLRDGRIQEIWMVADYLSALAAGGALTVRG